MDKRSILIILSAICITFVIFISSSQGKENIIDIGQLAIEEVQRVITKEFPEHNRIDLIAMDTNEKGDVKIAYFLNFGKKFDLIKAVMSCDKKGIFLYKLSIIGYKSFDKEYKPPRTIIKVLPKKPPVPNLNKPPTLKKAHL